MDEVKGRIADSLDDVDLSDLINGQTGRVSWSGLERHFARGALVKVSPRLDLVNVARAVIEDDQAQVKAWMKDGLVSGPDVEDARSWQSSGRLLWAVVAAPWILVQEDRAH